MQKTVLIVDDHNTLGDMMGHMVRILGHQAKVFTRAQDSLEWLERETPDVALLDLMMPGVDGLSLVEEIRARGYQFPIYVVTACGENQLTAEVCAMGALAVIQKPLSIETVQALIELDTEAAQARPSWSVGKPTPGPARPRGDQLRRG